MTLRVFNAYLLDPPLCFAFGTPYDVQQTSSGLSESYPKIGDVPKSPFPTVAALVPSAGTITLPSSDAGGAVAISTVSRNPKIVKSITSFPYIVKSL